MAAYQNMSDTLADPMPDAAEGGSIDISPDVSGDSSSPDTGMTDTDVFADVDFDATFGLTADQQSTGKQDPNDVPTATDPPISRQDAEVKTGDEAPSKGDTPEPDAAKADTTKDDQFALNEKLNWDDDKVPFREEFKNLKSEYMKLLSNSVEAQYISDPMGFANWMKEASPTSFNEVGGILATESAQAHPKEWIEFFAKNNPDILAQVASGREDITADRLRAELSVLLDDDDPDVEAALEKSKAAAAEQPKAEETPEQKEIREWREQRQREEFTKVTSEVFQPIERAVDSLVSEAGLEVNLADYADKNFSELDPETQFKVMVNEMLPSWIDFRIKQDPKLVAMQSRLEGFIRAKDVTSAKSLQHPAKIATTNFVNEFLSLITGMKAKAAESVTTPPAKDSPRPIVKSAGAGSSAAQSPVTGMPTKDEWAVTEEDLFGRG